MGKRKTNPILSPETLAYDFLQTERAVFISGEINDEMVARITIPIVTMIRVAEPISVFIDSEGGNVSAARRIHGLLRTPSQAGRVVPLTTVATGRAHSAAANLLAMGDYVAAYSHSSIHFHGTFLSDAFVTVEGAREHQQDLLQENRISSSAVARSVFPRLLWNYHAWREDVSRVREAGAEELKRFDLLTGGGVIDLPAFVYVLADRVQDRYGAIVLECLAVTNERDAVLRRYRATKDGGRRLSRGLRTAIAEGRDAESAAALTEQLALLEALLVERAMSDVEWKLADEDFGRLEAEFWQLQTVADEDWRNDVLDQVIATSDLVMSAEDRKFFSRYRVSDLRSQRVENRAAAIVDRAHAKLEPLWSFTMALCDALNRGENPISPQDAWSLGLVDEIIGMPLTRRPLPRRVKSRLLAQLPIAVSQEFY